MRSMAGCPSFEMALRLHPTHEGKQHAQTGSESDSARARGIPSKSLRALLKSRPGSRPQREQLEISRDPLARALLPAIKDMHVLVGHVHALLNGSVAEEAGVIDWLKRLQAELDLAHEAVMSGRMSSRGVITMEDEEPAGLDDALS